MYTYIFFFVLQSLKEEPPIIHFAPSIESGLDNDRRILTDSPVKLLYCGQLITEVPLIIGVNGQEGLYRALRKIIISYN